MADTRVTYSRTGDVHTLNTSIPSLKTLIVDNSAVPEEERGGASKQLLAASTLFCYCSTLGAALTARGAKYQEIKGEANLSVGVNDNGQGRVTGISLKAEVLLSEDDADVYERCARIVRQGCLVTNSVHEGLTMAYDVTANYSDGD